MYVIPTCPSSRLIVGCQLRLLSTELKISLFTYEEWAFCARARVCVWKINWRPMHRSTRLSRMQTGRLAASLEVCLIKPWNVSLTNARVLTSIWFCIDKQSQFESRFIVLLFSHWFAHNFVYLLQLYAYVLILFY